jgi:hypothetical protein
MRVLLHGWQGRGRAVSPAMRAHTADSLEYRAQPMNTARAPNSRASAPPPGTGHHARPSAPPQGQGVARLWGGGSRVHGTGVGQEVSSLSCCLNVGFWGVCEGCWLVRANCQCHVTSVMTAAEGTLQQQPLRAACRP